MGSKVLIPAHIIDLYNKMAVSMNRARLFGIFVLAILFSVSDACSEEIEIDGDLDEDIWEDEQVMAADDIPGALRPMALR